ncbi:MAG: MFS transporter, partial [Alphaproteobacteria bacterium]|nr:MFS transporter [Alphaproteobacteria bacterium]
MSLCDDTRRDHKKNRRNRSNERACAQLRGIRKPCPPLFLDRAEARLSSTPPRDASPFKVRSFRYQFPADLATSWAFEMETLILGWYVLVTTQSLLMLTIYAAMQHLGTLLSPMFGVMGDRAGQRNLLSAMRAFYAVLAGIIMALALTDMLNAYAVLGIAALMGLVRPSDIGMRTALVGETVPRAQLMSAMGLQRTTQDSAKIAGALSGAGLAVGLGMGVAYAVVTGLYIISCLLTLQTGAARSGIQTSPTARQEQQQSPLRDLKEGLVYVWTTPYLLGTLTLAFLLNLTAFPVFNGLLPFVAKDVYQADQKTLGLMIAFAASGALTGSLVLARFSTIFRPSRLMIYMAVIWFLVLLVFSQVKTAPMGMALLYLGGICQSLGMVSIATVLLRNSDEKFRGRIMGVRMLAIYGNMPGILLAGYLIPKFGYGTVAAGYCLFGIL